MTIHLIVAHGKNREIGYENNLLWHVPSDLKRFKQLTLNHIVVMGRKTYESIGHALPNRTNIVLTRDTSFTSPDILTNHTTDSILRLSQGKEIYIIGGAEVYRAFLPYADGLLITKIMGQFKADTYFPEYEHLLHNYTLLEPPQTILKDQHNDYDSIFELAVTAPYHWINPLSVLSSCPNWLYSKLVISLGILKFPSSSCHSKGMEVG